MLAVTPAYHKIGRWRITPATAARAVRLRVRAASAVLAAVVGGMVVPLSGWAHAAGSADTRPVAPQDSASPWKRLDDIEAGYTLAYPAAWTLEGQVVASDFAADARCRSVRVVDFAPPPDSGAAAPIQHSFVQVCAKPLSSVGSLDAFMRRTYGDRLEAVFDETRVNGIVVYETRQQEPIRMLFAELAEHLVQIMAAVETEPARRPERRAQVDAILASFAAL